MSKVHSGSKAQWGTKRVCSACGARYYDMRQSKPACPLCGEAFDPEVRTKTRRTRSGSDQAQEHRKHAAHDHDLAAFEDVSFAPESDQDDLLSEEDALLDDDEGVSQIVEFDE